MIEVLVVLIAGAWIASLLPPDKPKDPPKKPKVRMFPSEKIVRKKPSGDEEEIRYVTPVVHNYPVAWTESNNHRE